MLKSQNFAKIESLSEICGKITVILRFYEHSNLMFNDKKFNIKLKSSCFVMYNWKTFCQNDAVF